MKPLSQPTSYEKTGALPPEPPMLVDNGMRLFADAQNAATLANAAGGSKTLVGYLQAHLNRLPAGDYFCILAYMEMNTTYHVLLQTM
jgi:transaldolase/glucose-6-phosphate isomerase